MGVCKREPSEEGSKRTKAYKRGYGTMQGRRRSVYNERESVINKGEQGKGGEGWGWGNAKGGRRVSGPVCHVEGHEMRRGTRARIWSCPNITETSR